MLHLAWRPVLLILIAARTAGNSPDYPSPPPAAWAVMERYNGRFSPRGAYSGMTTTPQFAPPQHECLHCLLEQANGFAELRCPPHCRIRCHLRPQGHDIDGQGLAEPSGEA